MGKYVVENPFLKVSPRAYYPDYTVLAMVGWLVGWLEVPPLDGAPCVTGTGTCAGCGRLTTYLKDDYKLQIDLLSQNWLYLR